MKGSPRFFFVHAICILLLSATAKHPDPQAIAAEATCSYVHPEGRRELMCASAHYPSQLQPPRSVTSGVLVVHFGQSCKIEDLPPRQPQHIGGGERAEEVVLVVRRGGCSFSDKTKAAWEHGYDGLVIVDHPVVPTPTSLSVHGMVDSKLPLTPPFLAGLEAPSVPPASPLPPTVVLIRNEDFTAPSGDAASVARVALLWEDAWTPSDAATLYYDGMRLVAEGKHAIAAEKFHAAASSASTFKTPGYEWANALLRAGASTVDIVIALEEARVLPDVAYPSLEALAVVTRNESLRSVDGDLETPTEPTLSLARSRWARAWLAAEYASQARAAHRRAFGFTHDDLLARSTRNASSAWHVSPGLGLAEGGASPGTCNGNGEGSAGLWRNSAARLLPFLKGSQDNRKVHGECEEGGNNTGEVEDTVVVVTVATDLGAELSSLQATVSAAGLDFVVLGIGRDYGTRGGTKLALMEEWLLSAEFAKKYLQKDALVMFVDAYDVLVMPSAASGGLSRRFDSMNVRAVISGETGCWPDPSVAPLYPWPHYDRQPHFGGLYEPRSLPPLDYSGATAVSSWGSEEAATAAAMAALEMQNATTHDSEDDRGMPADVPFPYPNSGGYIARAGYMRAMISEVMDDVRSGHLDGGGTVGNADDQRWLQRHWLRYPREVAIDTYAEIFLSLHRCCPTIVSGAASDDGDDGDSAWHYHNHSITVGEWPGSLRRQLEVGDWSWNGSPPRRELAFVKSARAATWFNRTVVGGPHNVSRGPYMEPVAGQLHWGEKDRRHLATVWLALGENTAVAPIMVHGNGHGKRMLRIISCKMGLYCRWKEKKARA